MKSYERKTLLDKLERDVGTIGTSIPEKIEIEDTTVPLRRHVVSDDVDIGFTEEELKKHLRRRRLELVEEIEEGDVDFEEGKRYVERVRGLTRALESLESSGGDVEHEARAAEVADEKRWKEFLNKVQGGEDDRRTR